MTWWKKAFEIALWKSRLIVVLAVFPSIIAGVVLFCIIAIESFRDVVPITDACLVSQIPGQGPVVVADDLDAGLVPGAERIHGPDQIFDVRNRG